ncbi:hypothetical protein [Bacillus mobilis]
MSKIDELKELGYKEICNDEQCCTLLYKKFEDGGVVMFRFDDEDRESGAVSLDVNEIEIIFGR